MDVSTGSSSVSRSSGGLNKCNCGLVAKIGESKTVKNPCRRFFGCPLYKVGGTEHCKFFKWFDQEEVTGWARNALNQCLAEICEKEKVIYHLQTIIMELRSDLEKLVEDKESVEDKERVVYRQRLIITCLAVLLVCAVGAVIFG